MDTFYLDRYLRHQSIHWLDQNELFSLKVGIVGAGAIGNELLKNMLLLGIGNISIYDFDRIEIHNLTRSVLFSTADIGKSKVEVAVEKAVTLNPDVRVEGFHGDFYDFLNLENIKTFDALFSAADNFEARIQLHRLCYLAKVDFFNAGIDSQYVSVEYYPYKKADSRHACLECSYSDTVYQDVQRRYSCGWIQRAAYREKKISTTIITSSIAGALLLSLFLHRKKFDAPVRIFFDTVNFRSSIVNIEKNENCYFCQTWKEYRETTWEEFRKNPVKNKETIFFLNEPVLIRTLCPVCHNEKIYYNLSRKYKDRDLLCEKCGNVSEPEVKDSFSPEELVRVEHLPFKYLYYFENDSLVLVKK